MCNVTFAWCVKRRTHRKKVLSALVKPEYPVKIQLVERLKENISLSGFTVITPPNSGG